MRRALPFVIVSLAGCAEPVYDDDIGVTGVPVDAGALAGSFALLATAADRTSLPGLEDEVGGGITFYLVERTWDGARYAQTNRVCSVINFEVAGLLTTVSPATALAVPPFTVESAHVHETGEAATAPFFEMWALSDDVDGDDALPDDPEDERVVDMEGDEKPGATIGATGLVTGEIYVVQRKTLTFNGVIRSADESFGLITHKKEGAVLAATDALLDVDADRIPHPDPKQSWWHELRLADGAACADVDAHFADAVARARPF